MNILRKHKQKGAETLEFLVVFGFFMMLTITVFDLGRTLYYYNALAEAARRGARMAVVCPNDAGSQAIVRNVAVYNTIDSTSDTSPVIKDLTTSAIDIKYYDDSGNETADPVLIKFSEVSINDSYQFQYILPFVNQAVDVPSFRTTLYAESKGAVPTYPGEDTINPTCNF